MNNLSVNVRLYRQSAYGIIKTAWNVVDCSKLKLKVLIELKNMYFLDDFRNIGPN